MSDLQDFIDRFFSEEFRIQQIVNDALYEQKQQHKLELENQRKESKQELDNQRKESEQELENQRKESEQELENQRRESEQELENQRKESEQKLKNQRIQMRDKNIVDLSVKLKMSPQEIAEFTENSIELVVEVLNSQKL